MKIITVAVFAGIFLGLFMANLRGQSFRTHTPFYITFPYEVPAGAVIRVQLTRDKANSDLARQWATAHTGMTVWTESEWNNCDLCKETTTEIIDWPPDINRPLTGSNGK